MEGSEVVVPQESATIQAVDTALEAVGHLPEAMDGDMSVKGLKEKWVDGTRVRLKEPQEGGVVAIPSFTDAFLSRPKDREFFQAFARGFYDLEGKEMNVDALKRATGNTPDVAESEIMEHAGTGPFWVSRDGRRSGLAVPTKIPGVTIVWQGSAVMRNNSSDRTVSPIFHIKK